jgi:ActR/RegA family two-component response regulator
MENTMKLDDQPKPVLLVEDDHMLRLSLAAAMEKRGFQT